LEKITKNDNPIKRPHILGYSGLFLASMMFMNYEKLSIPSFGKGEQTYGSRVAKSINPAEWKEICKKKEQGRNELCACGSGKKYKKCCGMYGK
jgi:hypothetical protein